MTSSSSNFNIFPENQLSRSAGTVSSFSRKCQYAVPAH